MCGNWKVAGSDRVGLRRMSAEKAARSPDGRCKKDELSQHARQDEFLEAKSAA